MSMQNSKSDTANCTDILRITTNSSSAQSKLLYLAVICSSDDKMISYTSTNGQAFNRWYAEKLATKSREKYRCVKQILKFIKILFSKSNFKKTL